MDITVGKYQFYPANYIGIRVKNVNPGSVGCIRPKEFVNRLIVMWKTVTHDYPDIGSPEHCFRIVPNGSKCAGYALFDNRGNNRRITSNSRPTVVVMLKTVISNGPRHRTVKFEKRNSAFDFGVWDSAICREILPATVQPHFRNKSQVLAAESEVSIEAPARPKCHSLSSELRHL